VRRRGGDDRAAGEPAVQHDLGPVDGDLPAARRGRRGAPGRPSRGLPGVHPVPHDHARRGDLPARPALVRRGARGQGPGGLAHARAPAPGLADLPGAGPGAVRERAPGGEDRAQHPAGRASPAVRPRRGGRRVRRGGQDRALRLRDRVRRRPQRRTPAAGYPVPGSRGHPEVRVDVRPLAGARQARRPGPSVDVLDLRPPARLADRHRRPGPVAQPRRVRPGPRHRG
jgi:hypothetical protein